MNTEKTAWDFVEQYYPNYSTSEEIARNNDLLVIIETGERGNSEKWKAEQIIIREWYNESCKSIYEKAIEGYFEALKNVTVDNSHIVMPLSISDVDQVMEDNDIDYPLTEYGKLKVIEDCRDNFDANATYWDNLLESVNRIIEHTNSLES